MNTDAKYTVAVRALCEFTAKQGDLDQRFTPAPSAQEGIAGHAVVTARRGQGYQAEVTLSGDYQYLHVRGRADGYDPALNQLEEIKTFRGDLDLMPGNHRHLHWAQVKIYGWLLCQKLGLSELRLALVYFDIGSQKETVLVKHISAAALQEYFEMQCEKFLHWAAQELAHRTARDSRLATLQFPYAGFRPGQRELATAVYRANSSGRCLLAQAPTGIGKTIGTLFPVLKACPAQGLDKVFFLAAKTSGRKLALDAAVLLQDSAPALPLRVLELVARDKACEHPDKACHGESCPLAQGFYDRLPAARDAALRSGLLDKAALRAIALTHQVCPYYLSQELVRWADVVVGDYNYFFDISAMLHGLTQANQWRVSVLVDEAHNMIERGRKMYSAELHYTDFKTMQKWAPPVLKKSLDRIQRCWTALLGEQDNAYQVYAEPPAKLLSALQQVNTAITDYISEHPNLVDSTLQRFYFDATHFCRVAELFGDHSLFDISKDAGSTARNGLANASTLCFRNIIPAPFLEKRFAASHSCTLFSATLSPWNFYSDTLGLPPDTAWVEVDSPFTPEQLSVRLRSDISTRFNDRSSSLAPIADVIAQQYASQAGNYLAFFSSFDYLQQVLAVVRQLYPKLPVWEQSRRMDEAERDAFLARFSATSCGVGFAVLGGSFAEGIDLPGRCLIGAFIATLGLPQTNPVNQQIMQRMQAKFGAGYDYTYLYSGLQKVVQAAGRVIRTETDRGVVYLIDDRFAQREVQELLPRWWQA
ncbi:MAG: ATP-dependent DNA helicase [Pseudomonadota bacterium]